MNICINVRNRQWKISFFAYSETGLKCYCCGQTAGGSGAASAAQIQKHVSCAQYLYPPVFQECFVLKFCFFNQSL